MDANSSMQPPPVQPSGGRILSPTDMVGNLVPKSEDAGISFSKLSPDGLTSSAVPLPGGAVPFESIPDGTQAPPPSTMGSMDIVNLDSLSPTEPNAFLPTFAALNQQQQKQNHHSPPQAQSIKAEDMHGNLSFREQSPASARTSSSNPSLAASPVPAPPPFTGMSASSMASAFEQANEAILSRSRSGSLASPGATGSFNPQPSPPQPNHDTSFTLASSSEFAGIPRPDPVNSPHMLVVDDVLSK